MLNLRLCDLAEAVDGGNADMQWSLSADVLRRQLKNIFTRCYTGKISAWQSLSLTADFVAVGVANNLNILDGLFKSLREVLAKEFDVQLLPVLDRFEELFSGIDNTLAWAIDTKILRTEFAPLFNRLFQREISPEEALTTFVDNVENKKEMVLTALKELMLALVTELEARQFSPTEEKANNGED